VLLLPDAGAAERAVRYRAPAGVMELHRGPVRDHARQAPQPLFVFGNGAWKRHLVGLDRTALILAEVTARERAVRGLKTAGREFDHSLTALPTLRARCQSGRTTPYCGESRGQPRN